MEIPYYIEILRFDGNLTKKRGTVTRIHNHLFHFDNVIEYVNGQKIPRPSFYVPMNTHPNIHILNETYQHQFYKPVAEDLMTKQVLRGLGVDKETSWGLHKHHINPHIGRGGKRTRTQRIRKSKSKKSNKLRKMYSKRQRNARKTRSKRDGA